MKMPLYHGTIIPTIDRLKDTKLIAPTEFELMTALAFQYFAAKTKARYCSY
ncbi:hypothetical protein KHA80_16990 [Anaerobacillus sp. HL2]|nr:hypothetical protein KHA80_16990 [Anaerobacillus sp. HL2]